MAIIDRIKYDGPSDNSDWLIYKYPSESFVLGSQLIVNAGQEALFFKGGAALDLFGPGTHTLKTGNLPLLNKLVNLPFGGKTPFSAEIYYINKTTKLDMAWGTSNPIPFEDPKYGVLLSIRAHGKYGITIEDSRLFVTQLIGAVQSGATTNHILVLKYFNGMINTKVKDVIAKQMVRQKISFLEISAYLDDISSEISAAVRLEFDRFGVQIVSFFVEAISPPKEEYERLAKRKEEQAGYKMDIELGGFYDKKRSYDVLDSLAANSSDGGGAAAGMQLGMGLGVMGAIGSAVGGVVSNTNSLNPNNAPPVAPATAPAPAKICSKCNAPIAAGLKFCGECGERVLDDIKCPWCGQANPPTMKFCGECGKPLGNMKCPKCGRENEPGMKFCGECGEQLGGKH